MKKLFDKIRTECAECKTPLNGTDLLKRGGKYYCQSDFQRLSAQEKNENRRIIKEQEFIKKLYT